MIATTNSAIVPFYYQSECLEALETVEKTQNTALVLMAGGLGKTILSALYVKSRLIRYKEKRCLYLCHQNDILEQAEVDYRKVFGSQLTYGFFHGDKKVNLNANVIFASFQTLRENLSFYDKNCFDIVVVDETHHSKAETYEKTIRYYHPKFLLGISMIGDRLDGLDIREIYGKEIYHLSTVDALVRGLLCPIEYKLMSDEIGSLKKLETVHGKLSTKLLNQTIFVPKRDEEIAAIIQSHIERIKNPRAMIFCPSIEHAEMMAEMIRNSIPLHSGVPKVERKVRLELFRNGTFKAALSVDMFNEGLNVREVNLVVFLRSTSSPVVFLSQLMRGSRLFPGKEKVVVLDFVANCERVLSIYELWARVKTEREQIKSLAQTPPSPNLSGTEKENGSTDDKIEPFSLNVKDVQFKEKVFPIIDSIRKIREGFYQTWEEASEAVKRLGIKNLADYIEKYKQDSRLVSAPSKYYEDFPGWPIFIDNPTIKRFRFYQTWQEASEAVKGLGIENSKMYKEKYLEDFLLPVFPERAYPDFPGWTIFTGNNDNKRLSHQCYSTWQEASEASKNMGIQTPEEYLLKYLDDPKLPRMPSKTYEDFPGWLVFTGNFENVRQVEYCYSTWQEASEAAIKLGIKTWAEYKIKYKNDARLPSNPNQVYKDFPGHLAFLKKPEPGQKWYSTWQEASDAVSKLGITSFKEYQERYKEDSKLPSTPHTAYSNFPGMIVFLKLKYETWQEASEAAIKLGIKNRREYEKRYKENTKLPGNARDYDGFPGWDKFLGKK